MDETSDRPGWSGYLQATEPRPLPPPPVQARRVATLGQPVIAPARRAAGHMLAMQAMHWASVALCLGAFLVAWAIGNATDDEAGWP